MMKKCSRLIIRRIWAVQPECAIFFVDRKSHQNLVGDPLRNFQNPFSRYLDRVRSTWARHVLFRQRFCFSQLSAWFFPRGLGACLPLRAPYAHITRIRPYVRAALRMSLRIMRARPRTAFGSCPPDWMRRVCLRRARPKGSAAMHEAQPEGRSRFVQNKERSPEGASVDYQPNIN